MTRFWLIALLIGTVLHGAPNDIPNLVFALEAQSLVGLADGADVTSWVDPFNGSNSAAPPGTAPKKQTFRGHSVCSFTSGDKLLTNAFLDSSFDTAFTCVVVSKSNSGALATVASSGGFKMYVGENISVGVRSNLFVPDDVNDGALLEYATAQVCSYRYDGTNVKYWRNKVAAVTQSATGNIGATGALTIGEISTGGSSLGGYLRAIYFFNRALTDNEIGDMVDYCVAQSPDFADVNSLVFAGDSQSGVNAGTVSYGQLIKELMDLNGDPYNYMIGAAVSGRTLEIMESSAPVEIDPFIAAPSLSKRNVLLVWGGENDISADASTATVVARLTTFCASRRAVDPNCRIVLISTLPVVGDTAPHAQVRLEYNQWMAANYLTIADRFVPLYSNANLTDPANTTYFYDGVHLTDAGKQIVADLTYPMVIGGDDTVAAGLSGAVSLSGNSSIR